jgi:protein gp37
LVPDRMECAAGWGAPTQAEIAHKPWLAGLPRLIFISDMGDALSEAVSFDFLREEIIDNVKSVAGRRHTWLWLSKRPNRMAEFGTWLAKLGTAWPDNLVAMTTVTAQSNAGRVEQLRKVPSKLKGLSLEPLFEPVNLDLTSIDWVIVGGGSDVLAEPFHVEWALDLSLRCREAKVAFFLKQLGRHPFYKKRPLDLKNKHGGDWNEWSEEWRVRDFPKAFRWPYIRNSNT